MLISFNARNVFARFVNKSKFGCIGRVTRSTVSKNELIFKKHGYHRDLPKGRPSKVSENMLETHNIPHIALKRLSGIWDLSVGSLPKKLPVWFNS